MRKLKLPQWVQEHSRYNSLDTVSIEKFEELKEKLKRYNVEEPEVSIIIPAYNEENNLIKTLSSFAEIETKYRVELIVVNNASTDRTQQIIDRLKLRSVYVSEQGVRYARQAGLEVAKGKYILNADADTIYPKGWIEAYVKVLQNPEVSCVYGTYSFVPDRGKSRLTLGIYESLSEISYACKRKRHEFVGVLGFNFAFRKDDAMKVGGFRLDLDRAKNGKCEDGMMAYDLTKVGKLYQVRSPRFRVWTSDRIFERDGGLIKGLTKRIKKKLIALEFTSAKEKLTK